MRQICFVELVGCTFNLCMLGYYTITVYLKFKGKCVRDHLLLLVILILNYYFILSFQEWHEESINTIITYIMVLTAMMFNIFIFCFIGELVSDQVK